MRRKIQFETGKCDRNGITGSPNGLIDRTFRAIFQMPVIQPNHNLIKIRKRQYRNPVRLAQQWQRAIRLEEYSSPAALAYHLGVSRARVTQIMNLLKLSQEVIDIICSLGDPISSPVVSEKRLRLLLALTAEEQKRQLTIMLSKAGYGDK